MDNLEETLVDIVRPRGASGYTIVRAHGAGYDGEMSGELDVDTSIKFHVIVPQGRMSEILAESRCYFRRGITSRYLCLM